MPNESEVLWARLGLQAYPPQGHPLTTLRAHGFMFNRTSKARIHDRRSVFSAPDLRNFVAEVFRQGFIVAKPGQAS